jgi:recombination protein RecR
LMGALNPAEGTEIAQLSIGWLVERVGAGEVREVVFATDPDVEGEATALAAVEALEAGLSERPVMTRLARGVPSGGALEYLHRGVLMDAFEGRRTIGAKR